MPNVGPLELIVVLVIALLVLGPKRLPDAGRSVGAGMRNFKQALTGEDQDNAKPPALSASERQPVGHGEETQT
jgi:sec-independent protein translocase protein TatA